MSHHGIPNNVELFLLFVKLIYIDFLKKKSFDISVSECI
jgi:hypothetical protein